ncbi:hypothetical protein AB8A05_29920 [Tardiphaga sp. 538_B7_N1_4]|uniref:hypothetical protein n=1 Tax=Tardiphaga sp. 538_B7_N1_4 TaxID=3240778 RepID=UPI003F25B0BA
MTNGDADLPAWIKVLERPSLDPKLSDDAIIEELSVRLAALYERYADTPPVDGCPDIVLGLALDYLPCFRIRDQERLPVSGAPQKADRWAIRAQALGELRKREREAVREGKSLRGLPEQVARDIAKQRSDIEQAARRANRDNPDVKIRKAPSAKTVRNLMLQRIPFPMEWKGNPTRARSQRLLWRAATQMRHWAARR